MLGQPNFLGQQNVGPNLNFYNHNNNHIANENNNNKNNYHKRHQSNPHFQSYPQRVSMPTFSKGSMITNMTFSNQNTNIQLFQKSNNNNKNNEDTKKKSIQFL